LEIAPRFLRRIERARESLRSGRGLRLEDVPTEPATSHRLRR
jgi:hypothetical protein